MSRFLSVLALALGAALTIGAQTPTFEVATIRPSAGPIEGIPFGLGQQRTTADTLTARHTNFREIIQRAFSIGPQQLEGPEFLNELKFDLVGKAAQPATDAELWAMVRPLLVERFGMKYHMETREVSGLAMIVDKNGHKMKESEGGSNNFAMNAGVFRGTNTTMNRVASLLSAILRRPVRDETGLTGTYDFVIDTREYATPGQPMDLASMAILAFRESAGLKLESRRFEVEVMVIDHIERRPAEN